MANTMTGRVHRIGATETQKAKDGREFLRRELTLNCTRFNPYTGEPGFGNFPTFEFSGQGCAEIDKYKPGDVATVSFDLQGTEYTSKDGETKWFTRVRGYRIEPYAARVAEKPAAEAKPDGARADETPKPQIKPADALKTPEMNSLPWTGRERGTADDLPF